MELSKHFFPIIGSIWMSEINIVYRSSPINNFIFVKKEYLNYKKNHCFPKKGKFLKKGLCKNTFYLRPSVIYVYSILPIIVYGLAATLGSLKY